MSRKKEINLSSGRKPDLEENGLNVKQQIQDQRKKEKKLYPLRVDSKTIILVRKKNCNKKYAEGYRERANRPVELKGFNH